MSLVRKSASRKISPWVALPSVGWFTWFLLVPLGIVAVYSFATKGTYGGVVFRWSPDNYVRAAEWVYLRVLWNSIFLASITSIFCLLLGYPMAFVIATSGQRLKTALLICVVIPFWTNFVVRAYATKVLFLSLGAWLMPYGLGVDHCIVLVGMVTSYLPFMVLPLYASIERFDFTLLEAARDLGAPPVRVLTSILLPLTKRGMVTGMILVFTPALGEFVIPDLLGGAKTMLVGNLITEQFLRARDWPFGSALSFILMMMVLLSLSIYFYFQGDQWEGSFDHEA